MTRNGQISFTDYQNPIPQTTEAAVNRQEARKKRKNGGWARSKSSAGKAEIARVFAEVKAARKCPAKELWAFSEAEDWLVRSEIAARKDCPPDLQLFLAADPSDLVRAAIVKNKSAPPEVLARLRNDPSGTVQLAFQERVNPNA